MSKVGDAIVEQGNPLARGVSVRDDGSESEPTELFGNTVVEAENLEEAKALLDGHPFLAEGRGRFAVDIFEVLPVPV